MEQNDKRSHAVIEWMKANSSLAIVILVAIIALLYVYQSVPPSAKIEELKIEEMVLDQKISKLNEDYDKLLYSVDSLNSFIYEKELNWQNEIKQIKKRNSRTVPKARDEVIDSDVDEQLMWWNAKRSNAEPYEGD